MIDPSPMGGREPTIKDARKKILEAQRERLNLPADTPSVKYRHQRCWTCSLEVEPFPRVTAIVKLMPLTSTQWLTSLSFAPWFIPKVRISDEVESG